MELNFMKIYKQKRSQKKFAFALCIIAAIACIVFSCYTYFNAKNNPLILKNVSDYNQAVTTDRYVHLSTDNLYDLGISISNDKTLFGISVFTISKDRLVGAKLDDSMLIIRMSENELKNIKKDSKNLYTIKGIFSNFNDEEKTYIANKLAPLTKAGIQTLPSYLHSRTPIEESALYLVLGIFVLAFGFLTVKKALNNSSHALKSLQSFSNEDFNTTCMRINEELASSDTYTNEMIGITKNYIVSLSPQCTFALPLNQLMWAYKKTIQKKLLFFIPVNKINILTLVFSDKKSYNLNLNKDASIDNILEYISNNCGNCYVGYSAELETSFNKNFDDVLLKWKLNSDKTKDGTMNM